MPSKALLAAASAAAEARDATRLGVHVDGVRVAFDEVMAHVRGAIAVIEPVDSAGALRAAGVTHRAGTATFTGPGSADVEGEQVRFRRALVATGSDPAVPPIPGLAAADPLTSDTVWQLTELPARLVVLGGGTVGCELRVLRTTQRRLGDTPGRVLALLAAVELLVARGGHPAGRVRPSPGSRSRSWRSSRSCPSTLSTCCSPTRPATTRTRHRWHWRT